MKLKNKYSKQKILRANVLSTCFSDYMIFWLMKQYYTFVNQLNNFVNES
jgi:hypothetical protein